MDTDINSLAYETVMESYSNNSDLVRACYCPQIVDGNIRMNMPRPVTLVANQWLCDSDLGGGM